MPSAAARPARHSAGPKGTVPFLWPPATKIGTVPPFESRREGYPQRLSRQVATRARRWKQFRRRAFFVAMERRASCLHCPGRRGATVVGRWEAQPAGRRAVDPHQSRHSRGHRLGTTPRLRGPRRCRRGGRTRWAAATMSRVRWPSLHAVPPLPGAADACQPSAAAAGAANRRGRRTAAFGTPARTCDPLRRGPRVAAASHGRRCDDADEIAPYKHNSEAIWGAVTKRSAKLSF